MGKTKKEVLVDYWCGNCGMNTVVVWIQLENVVGRLKCEVKMLSVMGLMTCYWVKMCWMKGLVWVGERLCFVVMDECIVE